MADAAASGDEKVQEPFHRAENSSGGMGGSGPSGEASRAAGAEAEDSAQNGGRCERIRSDGEPLLGAAGEDRSSPGRGLHKILASAAHEQQQQQQLNDGLGVSPPKAPEDVPPKRNFQIPRKSREKKALFQPIIAGSREFDDVVNVLHSAYLECNSKGNFSYKKASLVHSELLEKEFIEKRRELKRDGRSEKELVESYAFLKIDRALVQNICENGLQVGHSKMTVLGNPSMGIYLSRFADLLQANTLDPRATGDVIIFKVIKGKMKSICDTLGVKPMDSISKSALDPTPKHECHVLKNSNKINSLLSYRAYERLQYYFYEYGFDEIRQRPRHVCPYAVVSFSYKDEKIPKYLPASRSKISSLDKIDKASYTLWKGQLLNKGTLVCHVALKSETRPLLPCKLPEKLDVDMVMSIEHLTRKISPKVFYKETYSGEKEEFRSGLYCSLYEVVEKTRSGSNLEGLLQKLEKDKLVIVKPLVDGGYLLLLSPCQMASPYDNQTGRPRTLQALFLFRNHRGLGTSTQKHDQKNASTSVRQDMDMVMPDLSRFIQSLHYAYLHSRKDPKSDLNVAVGKYIYDYLNRYSKFKQFFLYEYKPSLDEKRFLHAGPKNKSNLDGALRTYIFGSEAYQIPISKAQKMMDGSRKHQQFSPVSDYEAPEEESDCSKRTGKRNDSKGEMIAGPKKRCQPGDYDDRMQELINLIQCKKKNVDKESDTEENRSKSRSKRKIESRIESQQKRFKKSTSEKDCHYDGERASESLSAIIADLGGRDTDLRQQSVSDHPVTESVVLKNLLDALLADPNCLSAKLLNHGLAENNTRQVPEYESIPGQVKEEPELPDAAHVENAQLKGYQSSSMFETTAPCLPYSVDVATNEAGMEHMLHLKETSTGSVSSFDGCSSPCPSTPIEQKYHRQHSNSNNTGETTMNWKLIPITGGAGRVPEEQLREHGDNQTGLKSPEELLAYSPPKDASQDDPRVINRQKNYPFSESSVYDIQKGIEDGVYPGQEEKLEDQHEFATNHCSASKHYISEIIEKAILDEYKHFTNKIQETLQQKNIKYVSGISKPVFSAKERIMRLSQYICLQASDIAVQEYIEGLSEKLNKVALSSYGNLRAPYTCNSRLANDLFTNTALNTSPEEPVVPAPAADDFDTGLLSGSSCDNAEEDSSINEQKSLVTLDTGKEQSPVKITVETKLTADGNLSSSDPLQQLDKLQKPADNVNITTQPALADIITQMKPEMFNSIVQIIQDVKKNTVKFYIHEEQESTLCKEIKEYLIKLGNTEWHPEQFLRRRANLDKLLIIIQNEDIASQIHKVCEICS